MKKAFTLIELMIVVAIIAIIAAIAIPNLLESRMQANESNAIGALRSYAAAQATYKKANYSAKIATSIGQWFAGANNSTNGITKLGICNGLTLIPNGFALAINSTAAYQGYWFEDDAALGTGPSWKYQFGLFAYPAVYTKTGINTYFIDTTGEVKGSDTTGAQVAGSNVVANNSAWFNP